MNIGVVLGVIMAVLTPAKETRIEVKDEADIKVVCRSPETITVMVRKQKIYASTYKFFGTQWEEVDTESPYDPLPDELRISNEQLNDKYTQKCHVKK